MSNTTRLDTQRREQPNAAQCSDLDTARANQRWLNWPESPADWLAGWSIRWRYVEIFDRNLQDIFEIRKIGKLALNPVGCKPQIPQDLTF